MAWLVVEKGEVRSPFVDGAFAFQEREDKRNVCDVVQRYKICLLQIFLNYSELWNSSALTVFVKFSMYCGMFMWKLILSAADDSK